MSETIYSVLIAGGGASGLIAGIAAARMLPDHHKVIILEKESKIGKKLLATGNGRCNLSNSFCDADSFHGSEPRFARGALHRFSVAATLSLFEELGLMIRKDDSGRIYPYCNQSSAVLDVLRLELHRLNCIIETDRNVCRINREEPLYFGSRPYDASACFAVETDQGRTYRANKVILATGGLAAPALGSNGSGYELAGEFGHQLISPFPAIVPICLDHPIAKKCSGIRFEARAELIVDENRIAASSGEFLWTDYGISGIAAMELARDVNIAIADGDRKLSLEIDFLPAVSRQELLQWLRQRRENNSDLSSDSILTGIFQRRIGEELVRAGINNSVLTTLSVARLNDQHLEGLADIIKALRLKVISTRDWQQAQVTAGGLDVREFYPDRMESKLCSGLYAAGEIMDIDGPCGGFNLQWAWSSGWLAGFKAAGEQLKLELNNHD
jgi:predicted Rossmann fold flavoprotein